jgi:dTDP-4-amino-4,6-dideoxygalactose transaminase
MIDKPVVLGGKSLFEEKINFVRPLLPSFSEIDDEVREILSSGMLTKGKYLERFEKKIAAYLGVGNAIAVSSCTSGLMLVYQALNLTNEVIVPSFTFMASVSPLIWVGARPQFVDVDPGSTNIRTERVRAAISKKTSGIIAVHNFGNPAKIEELEKISAEFKIPLIFDAAHGFGSLYRGSPLGRQGTAQVFSLSPTKLVVAGEGGVVTTDDDKLAERIRIGREYGNPGNYDSLFAGINARMSEFNALLGIHGLGKLKENICLRNRSADIYRKYLSVLPGINFQEISKEDRSSYKDFSVHFNEREFGLTRDQIAECLLIEGIDTRKYYSPPVHRQKAYRKFVDGTEELKNTDMLADNSLSLPIGSHLDEPKIKAVCRAVERLHHCAEEIRRTFSKAKGV